MLAGPKGVQAVDGISGNLYFTGPGNRNFGIRRVDAWGQKYAGNSPTASAATNSLIWFLDSLMSLLLR